MRNLLPSARDWFFASLIILVGLGVVNVVLPLYVVPKFERIYDDALPGTPLPILTYCVVSTRILWALVALAWPIAGIIAVSRRHRAAGLILNLGALFLFALTGVTIIALFLPMTGPITGGLSDAPPTGTASTH